VSTRNLGERVEIRLRDNGNGIPAALRDRIFQPFFTTKPAGAGTGLGLSISHDIVVRGHRGELRVNSQEGRYAEFIVTLPRIEAAEGAGADSSQGEMPAREEGTQNHDSQNHKRV
jgi:signal transduction histidine kinase